MIHINTARKIIETRQPFSCLAWKISTGEVISYDNVVCTSTYHGNGTVNIKLINSGQIRRVRIITIFEINNEEIYL